MDKEQKQTLPTKENEKDVVTYLLANGLSIAGIGGGIGILIGIVIKSDIAFVLAVVWATCWALAACGQSDSDDSDSNDNDEEDESLQTLPLKMVAVDEIANNIFDKDP